MTALTRLGFSALPVFDSGFFAAVAVPLQVDYVDETWRIVATGAGAVTAVSVGGGNSWRRITNRP
jgi:hypothetical protein